MLLHITGVDRISRPKRPSERLLNRPVSTSFSNPFASLDSKAVPSGPLIPSLSFQMPSATSSLSPAAIPPFSADEKDAQGFDRSLHIHGLNVSFKKHLENRINTCPSEDLLSSFEKYKKHLDEISLKSSTGNPPPMEAPKLASASLPLSNISAKYNFNGGYPSSTVFSFPQRSVEKDAPDSKPETDPPKNPSVVPFSFGNSGNKNLGSVFNFSSSIPSSNPFSLTPVPSSAGTSDSFPTTSPSSDMPILPTSSGLSLPSVPSSTLSHPPSRKETDEDEDEQAEPPPATELDPYEKGPGEESDQVLYAVRCKIFSFSSESKKWIDLGISSLRINKSSDGKVRMLARSQDSTSKVLINVALLPSFSPELSEKSITFACMNAPSQWTKFLVRVKTPGAAKSLYEELTRAIPSPEE